MNNANTLNPYPAVGTWADTHDGQSSLGAESLAPRFSLETNSDIYQLPPHPISWKVANDKLAFKLRLMQAGLPTPKMWTAPENATQDYVIKNSTNSSDHELASPFKAGTLPDKAALNRLVKSNDHGSTYVEAFIVGPSMKVWFWGEHALFAQLHSCSVIIGDGKHSAEALAAARLQQAGLDWETCREKPAILRTLAYQGLDPETVLAAGQQAWLDYRHGRALVSDTVGMDDENVLPHMTPEQREQIDRIGCALDLDLQHEFGTPVLYCLDAVLDEQGGIWWLEMHSEPVLPAASNLPMLANLEKTQIPALLTHLARVAQPAYALSQR